MAENIKNPYRTDRVADELFVGREVVIADLLEAIRTGRNAIRAVIGGRGIGKSSIARQIEKRLGNAACAIPIKGRLKAAVTTINRALDTDIGDGNPVETLVAAVRAHAAQRIVLVIDELEYLLVDEDSIAFLENLKDAYEKTDGKLAVLVLGGTAVYDLLLHHASPFLRMAGPIRILTGIERDEAAQLIRQPLNLDVPDDIVDALWAETGGHPWLLQMFMEGAVNRATSSTNIIDQIPAAIRDAESRLQDIAFPIWWENMRERGRDVYHRLVRTSLAIPREEWVSRFGNDPKRWLQVLASTGVAALDKEMILPRGTLFQRWVAENHPALAPTPNSSSDQLDAWLDTIQVEPFERLVVRALAAWARATIEFPAAALKQDATGRSDNNLLQPEAFFQMHAIVALLQHERDIVAEPEALSMQRHGRSDIKVRSLQDPTRRACVEFKIYQRKDHEVVKQAIGYAGPTDTFAAVVSVDRCKRPLRPEYEARCFEGAKPVHVENAPEKVLQPAFFTVHARERHATLRVWHFLVQLGDT